MTVFIDNTVKHQLSELQLSEHFASVLAYMHTLISNLDYSNVFSWSQLVGIIEVALHVHVQGVLR